MYGSRFSRNRYAQWAAWVVSVFCLSVIFTGYLLSPGSAGAQEEQVAQVEEVKPTTEPSTEVAPAAEGAPPTEVKADGEPAAQPQAMPNLRRKVGEGPPSGFLDRAISFLGLVFFIGLAWLLSNNRSRVSWKLVGWGVLLQLIFALLIFEMPGGERAFEVATDVVNALLGFTNVGAEFIFKSFVSNSWEPALINFTFAVLPTIIFFSSLMTVLYHIGVMHKIVAFFAWIMQKFMGTSGAESLSAAANIFVGQTEAPLVVKPYVDDMTVSELMTVMTGGFATVAGGVMAIYVGMLRDVFPDIAGHLIAASVMSAPAALVIGKIMIPETETPKTMGSLNMNAEKEDINVLDAMSRGAAEGLKLALNVAAMLLAFLAMIALCNALIAIPQEFFTENPMTLEEILGVLFAPIAWIMGVPWVDAMHIGKLLGIKMVLNELVGYAELQSMLLNPDIQLQDRSVIIAAYALCGFANFGSIGIQLGGIGGIAPSRKHDLAKIAFRAMIAGTIAACMTATIAGILN